MPWYAKYDGVDGSSRSDGAHLLYDLVVPTGQDERPESLHTLHQR